MTLYTLNFRQGLSDFEGKTVYTSFPLSGSYEVVLFPIESDRGHEYLALPIVEKVKAESKSAILLNKVEIEKL
ncbi:MAG: hypothetical protein LBH98_05155 [Chitinispirillales bacterium]|jgi:hypothetical protein|nr:hypothetical protein [Chitinispirillales bacterium]